MSFGWGSGFPNLKVLMFDQSAVPTEGQRVWMFFVSSAQNEIMMAFTTRKDCLSVVVRSSRVVQNKQVFKNIVRMCMDPPTCLSLNVSTCKKREGNCLKIEWFLVSIENLP